MAVLRITVSVITAISIAAISYFLCKRHRSKSSSRKTHNFIVLPLSINPPIDLNSKTPLIKIHSLCKLTRCEIYGKAEFLSSEAGGGVKDRVALKIIEEALDSGELVQGGVITDGGAGNFAISLATLAPVYGYKCHFVIPDDAPFQKPHELVEIHKATVERVRAVPFTHSEHYIKIARRRAEEVEGGLGFFADHFENLANFRAHYEGTGPEIWQGVGQHLHAFVASAGTGGTIAGVSRFLKEQDPNIKCFLIDPPGSGLFNYVTQGVISEENEEPRLENLVDAGTITEGIGINRLTQNFALAQLDGAIKFTDSEVIDMSRYLMLKDGLYVGGSSALNCLGALKVGKLLGPGHTIVTVLCDNNTRPLTAHYDAHCKALSIMMTTIPWSVPDGAMT